MTLTQDGLNFICQNFGSGDCCVDSGLSWSYTTGGTNYPETGGTAQVVSRLASGLVDSVTMTSPATGTFTQTQLNTANGQTVTLTDCQQIAMHDTPAEGQWCYGGTPPPATCEDYTTQEMCESNLCYWYNNSCHSTPQQPGGEIPWTYIAAGVGVIAGLAVVAYIVKRKR